MNLSSYFTNEIDDAKLELIAYKNPQGRMYPSYLNYSNLKIIEKGHLLANFQIRHSKFAGGWFTIHELLVYAV